MQTQRIMVIGMLGMSLAVGGISPVFGAEHGGTAVGGKEHAGTSTAGTSASTPAAPAAKPAPAAPALKPIVIKFSGMIKAIKEKDVTVQDKYGVTKEMTVPAEAKVTHGSAPASLSDLKSGDEVTVEYTYDVQTGKRTVQALAIAEAAAAAPAATTSSTTPQ